MRRYSMTQEANSPQTWVGTDDLLMSHSKIRWIMQTGMTTRMPTLGSQRLGAVPCEHRFSEVSTHPQLLRASLHRTTMTSTSCAVISTLRRTNHAISSTSCLKTGKSLHNKSTHSHPLWKVIADKYDWSNPSDTYSRRHVPCLIKINPIQQHRLRKAVSKSAPFRFPAEQQWRLGDARQCALDNKEVCWADCEHAWRLDVINPNRAGGLLARNRPQSTAHGRVGKTPPMLLFANYRHVVTTNM
jgi:hypothetical protein